MVRRGETWQGKEIKPEEIIMGNQQRKAMKSDEEFWKARVKNWNVPRTFSIVKSKRLGMGLKSYPGR